MTTGLVVDFTQLYCLNQYFKFFKSLYPSTMETAIPKEHIIVKMMLLACMKLVNPDLVQRILEMSKQKKPQSTKMQKKNHRRLNTMTKLVQNHSLQGRIVNVKNSPISWDIITAGAILSITKNNRTISTFLTVINSMMFLLVHSLRCSPRWNLLYSQNSGDFKQAQKFQVVWLMRGFSTMQSMQIQVKKLTKLRQVKNIPIAYYQEVSYIMFLEQSLINRNDLNITEGKKIVQTVRNKLYEKNFIIRFFMKWFFIKGEINFMPVPNKQQPKMIMLGTTNMIKYYLVAIYWEFTKKNIQLKVSITEVLFLNLSQVKMQISIKSMTPKLIMPKSEHIRRHTNIKYTVHVIILMYMVVFYGNRTKSPIQSCPQFISKGQLKTKENPSVLQMSMDRQSEVTSIKNYDEIA